MSKERLLFLITILICLSSIGCGRIWGSVTWLNQAPSSTFAYACSTQVFLEGVINRSNAPANPGNYTYSISPALPSGLSLNPNTGVISGTPTVVTPMTAYTMTIVGAAGTTTTTLNIRTAAGYLVNDLTDSAFVGPGATCNSASGTCNIRSAIQATINSGVSQVVVMPSGTSLLTLGQLSITQGMDIYGDCALGTTIDGNAAGRVFSVTNSGNTSFNFLTIQNGLINNADTAGILVTNNAVAPFTVTISNSTIQNNTVTGAIGNPQAAGVTASGNAAGHQVTFAISNSLFYNNQMPNTVGGCSALGFGSGGNNFVNGTVTNTSFISNSGNGGAIYYAGNGLTVSNSLFYNNATTGGSGAFTFQNGATGPVSFSNDTFNLNSSTNGIGAGVMSTGGAGGDTANFTNCTFANNSAPGAGVFRQVPGGNLANNLFYNNGGSNCAASAFTSIGGNLTDSTAADCNLIQASDIVLTNAQLGLLQNNGGPTQTMALLPTSPAISHALVGSCPATDQRGDARHLPASCDIGAYEH